MRAAYLAFWLFYCPIYCALTLWAIVSSLYRYRNEAMIIHCHSKCLCITQALNLLDFFFFFYFCHNSFAIRCGTEHSIPVLGQALLLLYFFVFFFCVDEMKMFAYMQRAVTIFFLFLFISHIFCFSSGSCSVIWKIRHQGQTCKIAHITCHRSTQWQ